MPLAALNCPNCGGPVQKEDKNCRYCNASINFSPDYKQVKLVGFPCPKCGSPADKSDKFCSKCATALVVKCPSCRHDVSLGSIFCPNCRANFAVTKLIEEANQKKRALNVSYAEKEQQVLAERDNSCKTVRQRINQKAFALSSEAQKIGDQQFKTFVGYVLIFVVSVVPMLISLSSSAKDYVIAILFFGGVCTYFLAQKYYPPFVKIKKRKELMAEAAAMKGDSTWNKYCTTQETASLKQKDKDTEDKRAALKAEAAQEVQKVDEWLQESVASIH